MSIILSCDYGYSIPAQGERGKGPSKEPRPSGRGPAPGSVVGHEFAVGVFLGNLFVQPALEDAAAGAVDCQGGSIIQSHFHGGSNDIHVGNLNAGQAFAVFKQRATDPGKALGQRDAGQAFAP